ncbi:unnamed protein product [Auanema sp. JU1783]|nr:unnamed protein product [Auanema sp. JU1783]
MENTQSGSIELEEVDNGSPLVSEEICEDKENINDEEKTVEEQSRGKSKKRQQTKYRYCLVCRRRCPSYYAQIFTTIPSKREQWLELLSSKCEQTREALQHKLKDIHTKNTYICYDHFHPSQFLQCYISRSRILSRHAKPEPYVEKEFITNRHAVKSLKQLEEPSSIETKPKTVKRKTAAKPNKTVSYKTSLFQEILSLPTEHLTSTEWVKLQINLELLRRIRMTTVNNFPDLSISPIRGSSDEINGTLQVTHEIIDLTRSPDHTWPITIEESHSPSHISLSRIDEDPVLIRETDDFSRSYSRVFEQRSLNLMSFRHSTVSISSGSESSEDEENDENDDVQIETPSEINKSSEEAFKKLERAIEPLLDDSDSDGDCEEDFIESDVYDFLGGIKVFVDVPCEEQSSDLKGQLRKMGAVVSRQITSTTSHIVFADGGSKTTLDIALSMEKKPILVDPHWVFECFKQEKYVSENMYSLYGGRYLIESLRRVSTALSFQMGDNPDVSSVSSRNINLSRSIQAESHETDESYLSNSISHVDRSSTVQSRADTTASMEMTFDKPMTATQLLVKIKKLTSKLDKLTSNTNDRSFRKKSECPPPSKPIGDSLLQSCVESLASKRVVHRRRTHAGFVVSHREPLSIAHLHQEANKNESDAVTGRLPKITERGTSPDKEVREEVCRVVGVNDMRKTVPADLREIRETLMRNASYRRRGSNKSMKLSRMFGNMKIDNRKNINDSQSSSVPSLEPPRGRRIVKTASKVINNLQCIPSSDEFVGRKESRVKNKEKLGIVFTSFRKYDEALLKQDARVMGLRIQTEITQNTRCVISATGSRTLTTLRGVVNLVPIVHSEWLKACLEKDSLVPFDNYEYDNWNDLIEERASNPLSFESLGYVLVTKDCSPPCEELTYLIRKSGGKITHSILECHMVVTSPQAEFEFSWGDSPPPVIVNEKYVLDCITQNRVLDCENYISHRIESVSDED